MTHAELFQTWSCNPELIKEAKRKLQPNTAMPMPMLAASTPQVHAGRVSWVLCVHAGVFAELETAAWKDARRFRLLAVDSGHLSFADYYLQTPSRPSTPSRAGSLPIQRRHNDTAFAITAEDESAAVGDFFVLVTYPPDGRYSVHQTDARGPAAVRALVVPAVVGADILPKDAEASTPFQTNPAKEVCCLSGAGMTASRTHAEG